MKQVEEEGDFFNINRPVTAKGGKHKKTQFTRLVVSACAAVSGAVISWIVLDWIAVNRAFVQPKTNPRHGWAVQPPRKMAQTDPRYASAQKVIKDWDEKTWPTGLFDSVAQLKSARILSIHEARFLSDLSGVYFRNDFWWQQDVSEYKNILGGLLHVGKKDTTGTVVPYIGFGSSLFITSAVPFRPPLLAPMEFGGYLIFSDDPEEIALAEENPHRKAYFQDDVLTRNGQSREQADYARKKLISILGEKLPAVGQALRRGDTRIPLNGNQIFTLQNRINEYVQDASHENRIKTAVAASASCGIVAYGALTMAGFFSARRQRERG